MDSDEIIKVLKNKKQIVLQGAPGTGKTYITAELAVRMCDGEVPEDREKLMARYRKLIAEGRIAFTTFHQSMDYEQFVEGFVPQIIEPKGKKDESKLVYRLRDGIFKIISHIAIYYNAYQILVKLIQNKKVKELKSETDKSYNHLKLEQNEDGDIGIYLATSEEDNFLDNRKNNDSKLIRWNKICNAINSTRSIDEAKQYLKDKPSGDSAKQIAVFNKLIEIAKSYSREYYSMVDTNKNFVLIIDEINRGNISKILGELITLLEADKRAGEENCVSATLPYSNETFSVPSNLYIIGTMNTADRSVGYIDYAVRRRFAFKTITSDRDVIKEHYEMLNSHDQNLGKDILNVYNKIENHIYTPGNISSDIKPEDIMVGHSYFLAKDRDDFSYKLQYEILPLLAEYHGDGLLNAKLDKETIKDIWPLKS